jgi:hypothetical protein
MAAGLTPELEAAWHEDGWCLAASALPGETVRAAQVAVAELLPTAAQMDGGADDDTNRWRDWDAAWPEFPFEARALNDVVMHETVIGIAEQLLGSDDIRCYSALLTAKYANQPSGYNRLLHADYPNQTLAVPRRDLAYQQVEMFVYLSDVTLANGATRFVSHKTTAEVPVEEHTLNLTDYAHLYNDDGAAIGAAGTIVCYRPDVYHRSVDITEPGQSRFMMHVAFRPAAVEWGGYQAWPFKGFQPAWHNWVRHATPRQLALLGFPRPGDPYWNAETIAGVGTRYPGLDMTPWRQSLA